MSTQDRYKAEMRQTQLNQLEQLVTTASRDGMSRKARDTLHTLIERAADLLLAKTEPVKPDLFAVPFPVGSRITVNDPRIQGSVLNIVRYEVLADGKAKMVVSESWMVGGTTHRSHFERSCDDLRDVSLWEEPDEFRAAYSSKPFPEGAAVMYNDSQWVVHGYGASDLGYCMFLNGSPSGMAFVLLAQFREVTPV